MKFLLNPIKGFILWTWQCFTFWLKGIESVTKKKPVYWNIAHTFTNTKEDLDTYLKEVEKLIKRLRTNETAPQ